MTDYTAWAADVSEQVTQIRRAAHQTQQSIAKVRGRANAINGAIEVVVDARGRVQTLHLAPPALRLAPEKLASAILDCILQAEQDSRAAAAEVASPFADDPRTRDATELLDSFTADIDENSAGRASRRSEPSNEDYFEQLNNNPLGEHRGP